MTKRVCFRRRLSRGEKNQPPNCNMDKIHGGNNRLYPSLPNDNSRAIAINHENAYEDITDIPDTEEDDRMYNEIDDAKLHKITNDTKNGAHSTPVSLSSYSNINDALSSNGAYEFAEPMDSTINSNANAESDKDEGYMFAVIPNDKPDDVKDDLHKDQVYSYDHLEAGTNTVLGLTANYDAVNLCQNSNETIENDYDHLSRNGQSNGHVPVVDSLYDHTPFSTEGDYDEFGNVNNTGNDEYVRTCF